MKLLIHDLPADRWEQISSQYEGWQIIFDKDDTDLIQKVELTDDGGLYEAYQDGE